MWLTNQDMEQPLWAHGQQVPLQIKGPLGNSLTQTVTYGTLICSGTHFRDRHGAWDLPRTLVARPSPDGTSTTPINF